jgi:hypothetical protein
MSKIKEQEEIGRLYAQVIITLCLYVWKIFDGDQIRYINIFGYCIIFI